MPTTIGWTDETWNPTRGCSRVSPGCEHCYAERVAHRFSGPGMPYEGLTVVGNQGPRWSGVVRLDEAALRRPLHWRKPRRVFVNSMSDLFHEALTDGEIERVFAVMALCPLHTFQILTKRATRMRDWFSDRTGPRAMNVRGMAFRIAGRDPSTTWPLPNVWLGVSVEDQQRADERVHELLATPAAVRFVSAEPLLGPVDLRRWLWPVHDRWPARFASATAARAAGAEVTRHAQALLGSGVPLVRWVIAGGESGPGARPCEIDWLRDLRQQCVESRTPYFLKQLGGERDKRAGEHAVLDGRLWQEFPAARAA